MVIFLEGFSQVIFVLSGTFCLVYHLFLKKWFTMSQLINFFGCKSELSD